MPPFSRRSAILIFLSLILVAGNVLGAERFPGKHWSKYAKPEDAGFSSEKLAQARAYYDSTQASALFVVYRGAVIADWGESARRFMCHSMRKSLMSAMYGVYIDNGAIDTNLTLEQLGIDESPSKLTPAEKKARIADLLAARSGIYLPAAYEPSTNPKPPRGSFAPGANWCYNNWDFNVLLTIFEQLTKKKFFDEFDQRLAKPVQMQDYHPYDGYYHFERDKSMHAAYPFRMSARDLARFGLLFLNKGEWREKQLLSKEYAARSTSRISEKTWTGAYGFLWWLYDAEPFKSLGMYSALGLGEHAIHVIPGAEIVFVIRTNTYVGDQVTRDQHLKLVKMFLAAMTGTPSKNPRLQEIPDQEPGYASMPITSQDMTAYTKDYPIGQSGLEIKAYPQGDQLMLDFGAGTFPMLKLGQDHFLTADYLQDIYFVPDSNGNGKQLVSIDALGTVAGELMAAGKSDEAIQVLATGDKFFANDPQFCTFMGEAYFNRATSEIDSALARYNKATRLAPKLKLERTSLGWWLPAIYREVYPADSEPAHLQRFTGTYGQRTVVLDSGKLVYSRAGSPKRSTLVRLTESIFGFEGDDTVRLMFPVDGEGRVYKLVVMYQDGRRDESVRVP
jgi:CubicO group peptidase (beta-lactamase class C family)